jgi:hypothetical protein
MEKINSMPAFPALPYNREAALEGDIPAELLDGPDEDAVRQAVNLVWALSGNPALRSYLVNVLLGDEILNLVRKQLEGDE